MSETDTVREYSQGSGWYEDGGMTVLTWQYMDAERMIILVMFISRFAYSFGE